MNDKAEIAYREWDYEKRMAHEQATKNLHKVKSPTAKQYWMFFLGCCIAALVVAGIIYETVVAVFDGFKKSFGY
jgi:hypothetical protein